MKPARGVPTWTLGLGLGLIVAAVVACTALEEHIAGRIDSAAAVVSRDVAPAVAVLGEVRLLTTYQMERTRAEVQGSPWAPVASGSGLVITLQHRPPASTEEAERRLETILGALAAPRDAPELGLVLAARVRGFEDAIRRTREQLRRGDTQTASNTLRIEANAFAVGVHLAATALLEHEAAAADSAARQIEDSRHRLRTVQLILVALVCTFAFAAAVLVLWTFAQVNRAHELQREASEARADELESFAGRVAHDVLGPLSAVSSALYLAKKHGSPPIVQSAAVRAGASLGRVKRIVDGLLTFARAGAQGSSDARAEVRPVVAGLLDELSDVARRANAVLATPGDLPACGVRCSEGVLLSMLSNLLRNALKYLGSAPTREVTLTVTARDDRVLFEVADTGPGVPPQFRDHIFEPYVRAATAQGMPGIGLGLATVRRLAASHGGCAGHRPRPEGGSVFWFELPAATHPAALLATGTDEVH
jgi:signal transduction histidine kinase